MDSGENGFWGEFTAPALASSCGIFMRFSAIFIQDSSRIHCSNISFPVTRATALEDEEKGGVAV
jgi:hypothetical protein